MSTSGKLKAHPRIYTVGDRLPAIRFNITKRDLTGITTTLVIGKPTPLRLTATLLAASADVSEFSVPIGASDLDIAGEFTCEIEFDIGGLTETHPGRFRLIVQESEG